VARRIQVPLAAQACRRVRDTPPQAALQLGERAANLREAFSCDIDLRGKRIALVDDVMTSGASLAALAQAARRQGAEEVDAWVVARTLPHG
jgi:predicted amidophosphoribosyltransferase